MQSDCKKARDAEAATAPRRHADGVVVPSLERRRQTKEEEARHSADALAEAKCDFAPRQGEEKLSIKSRSSSNASINKLDGCGNVECVLRGVGRRSIASLLDNRRAGGRGDGRPRISYLPVFFLTYIPGTVLVVHAIGGACHCYLNMRQGSLGMPS